MTAAAFEIRLLGPVELAVAGAAVRLGGVRQRTVFGLLALQCPAVVSVDHLVDARGVLPGARRGDRP